MADIAHIGDQFGTTVEPRILEQYKDSERWKSCLKAVVDQLQLAEDATFELAHVLDFESETPTGERLDWLAGLVNLKRSEGESDTSFFARFLNAINSRNAGTPDAVIYGASVLSGSATPQYIDEAPATFLVYTGPHYDRDGNWKPEAERHLTRSQVRKLAPAGVLGLPGRAIALADGRILGTSNESRAQDRSILLMVASDEGVDVTRILTDMTGRVITDGNGRVITV